MLVLPGDSSLSAGTVHKMLPNYQHRSGGTRLRQPSGVQPGCNFEKVWGSGRTVSAHTHTHTRARMSALVHTTQ